MWTVTLILRKNTKSGAAIQKALREKFKEHYCPPGPARIRTGVPDHLVEVTVSLQWAQAGNYVQWAVTLEPLTVTIAEALKTAGVKIVAQEINAHKPQPGNRVELTFRDLDNYVTYYTFETEGGKKKAREDRKAKVRPPQKSLMEIYASDNSDEPNPFLNI